MAEALYLVNSQDADPHGTLLDCLLILDDLVRATRLHMPERYQALLTELTARLTEGKQLKQIFSNSALAPPCGGCAAVVRGRGDGEGANLDG